MSDRSGAGGKFLSSQQLGDIGFRHFGGSRQLFLFKSQFFQSLFDDKTNVHRCLRPINRVELTLEYNPKLYLTSQVT